MQNLQDNRRTNTDTPQRAEKHQEMQTAEYNDRIQGRGTHEMTPEPPGQQIENHHECCSKS